MKVKTIHGDSPEEIKQAFTDCVSNDFQPTLAFAFIPYKPEINPYCKILEKKGIAVFGTSRFGKRNHWYVLMTDFMSNGEIGRAKNSNQEIHTVHKCVRFYKKRQMTGV